jgi:organic radical activating enzyme
MNKLQCGYPWNALFLMKEDSNYIVKSCCEQQDLGYRVKTVKEILTHEYIESTRESFKKNQWPKGCESCQKLEEKNLESQRQRSFKIFQMTTDKINPQHFDIRLDNYCNLKCIICNPINSSRWEEDRDVYILHNGELNKKRTSIDDEEIENLIKNAKSIIALGGEPLVSKKTLALLDKVEDPSDCVLFITTNAVSWNERADKIMSKPWKSVIMILSIDAIGQEFEIQRFPAKWQDAEKFTDFCIDRNWIIAINTTVSALNWQSITSLTEWAKTVTPYHQLNILSHPEQLHINALKPEAIDQINTGYVSKTMEAWKEDYSYDPALNQKLKDYLNSLDQRRGTNSKLILPWCWL